jgi:hypothetical protein
LKHNVCTFTESVDALVLDRIDSSELALKHGKVLLRSTD